jgi:hypothetical protein
MAAGPSKAELRTHGDGAGVERRKAERSGGVGAGSEESGDVSFRVYPDTPPASPTPSLHGESSRV